VSPRPRSSARLPGYPGRQRGRDDTEGRGIDCRDGEMAIEPGANFGLRQTHGEHSTGASFCIIDRAKRPGRAHPQEKKRPRGSGNEFPTLWPSILAGNSPTHPKLCERIFDGEMAGCAMSVS